MKKFFLILIAATLFFGCKTIKNNVKETSKTEVSVQNDIRETVTSKEETVTIGSITSLVEELTNIIERIITVKLSAPDSLNNQYPVEITTTEREYSKGKTTKYDSNSKAEQTKNINSETAAQTKIKAKEETDKIDKTTSKKTTPGWVFVVVIILSIGILIIIFLFLKKYKVI